MEKVQQNSEGSSQLATEPVGKLLFKLAVPAVVAQIVNMLYNVVDRIYIGHIPEVGADALTGVGVCMPVILLISAFAALVSMGAAPKSSISMGAGDNDEAELILGNSTSLLIIVSIVLTAVFLIWGQDFLWAFGASENTFSYAWDYMAIYVMGTIFVQLALGLNAFITAQGFAKTSMLTVLIGAVANIILDPIFIFVFDMGVKGAAIATVISQALSAVWVVYFLLGKRSHLKIKFKNLRLKKHIVLPSIALGVSPFIMQSTESLINLVFNKSLAQYGGDLAVGSMAILSSAMMFAMLPLSGLTQGAQPIVSYNYGANDAKRVKDTFFTLLKACLAFSGIIWLVIMLFPKLLPMMFTNDAALLEYATWAIRIYMGAAILLGAQLACQQTFIALGNAKASVFLAILRKILLLIPLIFILPRFMDDKVFAVFFAEPVADVIAVLVTVTLFGVQFSRTLREMKKKSLKKA